MSEEKTTTEISAAMDQMGDLSEESWKAHVAGARAFRGSDTEYCRRRGLDPKLFRSYKKKHAKPKPGVVEPKAFVQIQCAESQTEPKVAAKRLPESAALPDPRWLAEFVTHLFSAHR
jgi:hypothetical protein